MTFVVTENCIKCKYTECVNVCPVDAFRETSLMLVIDPDACIDCSLCEPECPSDAIYSEKDIPIIQDYFKPFNENMARISPAISERKPALPNAAAWRELPCKEVLLGEIEPGVQPQDPNGAAARYDVWLTEKQLTPAQWEAGLAGWDLLLRRILLSRSEFPRTRMRLAAAISDPEATIRQIAVLLAGKRLTSSDIDLLLKDPSPEVRRATVSAKADKLTPQQIDVALRDTDSRVRTEILGHSFIPSREQFQHVLNTGSEVEVNLMLHHISDALAPIAIAHPYPSARLRGYMFRRKLTSSEIASGLRDICSEVQAEVISRPDVALSEEQILICLLTCDDIAFTALLDKATRPSVDAALTVLPEERAAMVIREAPLVTADQLLRCFSDPRPAIALAALSRSDLKLTETHARILLASNSPAVRNRLLALFPLKKLSADQIETCLFDEDSAVRAKIVRSKAVTLTHEQVIRALGDPAGLVRRAVVRRISYRLTPAEYRCGVEDKDKLVRKLFKERFRLVKGKVMLTADLIARSREPAEQRLKNVLVKMNAIATWTRRKHELAKTLPTLAAEAGYIVWGGHFLKAWCTVVGDDWVIDVPDSQKGALSAMAGSKAHIICVGRGKKFTFIWYAAKAVKPNQITSPE